MSGAPVERFAARSLLEFGTELLSGVGIPANRARVVAEVLLEADLLGRTTHGFSLLSPYLHSARSGGMQASGDPAVMVDTGSAFTWDGRYLPGPWLVRRAIDEAQTRLADHPVVTGVIRRSHHVAGLQAYLKAVTDRGRFILLTASVPSLRQVAPFGALEGCYSPNPFAAGIPTDSEPVLVDISLTTTAGFGVHRAAKAGERLRGKWLVDAHGNPTDDPGPFVSEGQGALYNLGGADLGYKGFGLALMVEAMTSGLAGYGRADGEDRWSSSVFVQIIEPEQFGGREAFLRETSFLARACIDSGVPPGSPKVHLPGHTALARREEQLRAGVALHPAILPELLPWANELDVPVPRPQ